MKLEEAEVDIKEETYKSKGEKKKRYIVKYPDFGEFKCTADFEIGTIWGAQLVDGMVWIFGGNSYEAILCCVKPQGRKLKKCLYWTMDHYDYASPRFYGWVGHKLLLFGRGKIVWYDVKKKTYSSYAYEGTFARRLLAVYEEDVFLESNLYIFEKGDHYSLRDCLDFQGVENAIVQWWYCEVYPKRISLRKLNMAQSFWPDNFKGCEENKIRFTYYSNEDPEVEFAFDQKCFLFQGQKYFAIEHDETEPVGYKDILRMQHKDYELGVCPDKLATLYVYGTVGEKTLMAVKEGDNAYLGLYNASSQQLLLSLHKNYNIKKFLSGNPEEDFAADKVYDKKSMKRMHRLDKGCRVVRYSSLAKFLQNRRSLEHKEKASASSKEKGISPAEKISVEEVRSKVLQLAALKTKDGKWWLHYPISDVPDEDICGAVVIMDLKKWGYEKPMAVTYRFDDNNKILVCENVPAANRSEWFKKQRGKWQALKNGYVPNSKDALTIVPSLQNMDKFCKRNGDKITQPSGNPYLNLYVTTRMDDDDCDESPEGNLYQDMKASGDLYVHFKEWRLEHPYLKGLRSKVFYEDGLVFLTVQGLFLQRASQKTWSPVRILEDSVFYKAYQSDRIRIEDLKGAEKAP